MKTARWFSICILILTGFFSMYGGIVLIRDPTGQSISFPFSLLTRTIFTDYTIIGWVLIVTVGLFSITIIICTIIKTTCYSFQMMVQGVIICVYVFMVMLLSWQILSFEYIFLATSIALIALGSHQYQRKIVVESRKKEK